MRDKLLEHLYGAFNKDPNSAVALAISHGQGVSWSIANRRLIVKTESGAALADLSLTSGTISQIGTALSSAGITVSNINPAMGALHPGILLDGAGVQSQSNGNVIHGNRSLLWAILSSYAIELEVAGEQVAVALQQAYLASASGEWLDFWGGFFGLLRREGQGDAPYLIDIVRETLRLRTNRYAIENAIFDATGKAVSIEEPWMDVFRLDASALSSKDKFQDGVMLGRYLIRPVALQALDWSDVLPVINRNRPAGVLVLPPMSRFASVIDATSTNISGASISREMSYFMPYEDRSLLDQSVMEMAPILNHPALCRREVRHRSYAQADGFAYLVDSRTWRDYRSQSTVIPYPSQNWINTQSWRTASSTWGEFTVAIDSVHTRST